jgi:UDP-N-acetylbacillosamine N-acetyltransferase
MALVRAVVWGASGHARVVADAARLTGAWEIVGFIDEVAPEREGSPFAGGIVLGGSDVLRTERAARADHVLLGVGSNSARLRIADVVEAQGLALGVVIHPRAVVASDVVLGDGVFIAAGAVINPGATIGRAVIVNTNAVVEHDCQVDEGAHVAPGALLAGGVSIGRLSTVGIGAIVKEKLSIGAETLVGAGSVVVRPLGSRLVAYGIPAAKRRDLG